MSDERILPPWVPVRVSNPPDVLESMAGSLETIDRLTDRIIERSTSSKTQREIAIVWDCASFMHYQAVREIKRLREEATRNG